MNGLTNAVKYSNAVENGAIQVVVSLCTDETPSRPSPTTRVSFARVPRSQIAVFVPPQLMLCIDVLDRGPGLCGLSETVAFADFMAPVVAPVADEHAVNALRVGSSGVGLPICDKFVPACVVVLADVVSQVYVVFVFVFSCEIGLIYSRVDRLSCTCVCIHGDAPD